MEKYKPTVESVVTPEQQEAERIAKEKLQILTTPGFKDFAIRFETLEQYEDIVKNGKLNNGAEIFVPDLLNSSYGRYHMDQIDADKLNKKVKEADFNEYLESEGVGDWQSTMEFQTDMPKAASALASHKYLLDELKRIRSEVSLEKSNGRELDIQKETLSRFRDELLENKDSEIQASEEDPSGYAEYEIRDQARAMEWIKAFGHIDKICKTINQFEKEKDSNGILYSAIQLVNQLRSEQGVDNLLFEKIKEYYKSNIQNENRPTALKIGDLLFEIEALQEEERQDLDTLFRFAQDPAFIHEDGSLRKVIQALVKNTKPDKITQYHLAMIYHKDATNGAKSYHDAWRRLADDKDGKIPNEHLLGVIVMLSDRELVNKVTEFAKQSGKISHPVFDSQKIVRWPK